MIVEILGAQMLAPYFGTSHFVWTAQIGVTLLALAAGYYAGGWLADRSPRLGYLYGAILLAAIYLCLTVLMVRKAANLCLEFNLATGSLLASAFLFFIPLSLLAMVGPFFVRFVTESVAGVGGSVGRLTAISTLGSVAGTVLISYVLIPFLPKSVTMYLTAGVLMLVAAGYFVVQERRAMPLVLAGCAIGLGLGYGGMTARQPMANSTEIEQHNSNFGTLQVVYSKDGLTRFLLNDFLIQNAYDPIEKKSRLIFSYMLHGLANGYATEIKNVLCIGMGVGIVPMEFVRDGAKVDVVEINPSVVPLARRHFDFEPERVRIVIDDGRHFINVSTNRYDAVILDAFLGDSSPWHLMTQEAFSEIRERLRPGGVLAINTFGDFAQGNDFSLRSIERTLRAVFRSVKVHNNYLEVGVHNVFFAASDQAELGPVRKPDLDRVHAVWKKDVQITFGGVVQGSPTEGRVLTDDFNPVPFYDAHNREQFRRKLVEWAATL